MRRNQSCFWLFLLLCLFFCPFHPYLLFWKLVKAQHSKVLWSHILYDLLTLFGKIMFQLNSYCKYLISFFKSSWVFIIFFIVLLSFMGWLILFKKTYAYWFVLYLTLCFFFFFGLLTNGTPLNKLKWWHQKVTKHFDHVW